jgi:hypothetical protein
MLVAAIAKYVGTPALMMAVNGVCVTSVKLLLAAGADVNAKNNER